MDCELRIPHYLPTLHTLPLLRRYRYDLPGVFPLPKGGPNLGETRST